MIKSKLLATALCTSIALLGGCARQISPNVYTDTGVGEISRSVRGLVISAREVQVNADKSPDKNTGGLLGGGIAGGLLGSQIGGGRGQLAAAVAGAAAGAIAGSLIQGEMANQMGMEYTVELPNRSLKTVVQGLEPRMQVGQRVILISSKDDRSRIVPDMSLAAPNQYMPNQHPMAMSNQYAPNQYQMTAPNQYAPNHYQAPVPTQYVPMQGAVSVHPTTVIAVPNNEHEF